MRAFRVFNNVDESQVHVEWTVLGLRWRLPFRMLLFGALLIGVALARMVSLWLGIPIGLILAMMVVHLVREVNGMDPDGHLREFTQLSLLLRTGRRPVINNFGRR